MVVIQADYQSPAKLEKLEQVLEEVQAAPTEIVNTVAGIINQIIEEWNGGDGPPYQRSTERGYRMSKALGGRSNRA